MGLLTPCSVPRGGFLYTIIVPGGGFLLPSSRVPRVCRGGGGGMVMDEIDTCIRYESRSLNRIVADKSHRVNIAPDVLHQHDHSIDQAE